ncbi:cupin domain-containing protein [Robiginitalea biformata]|uniref:cupin domain-containing protein n=1 Tax=Robiginitalea biformata TaxID=252307 RepID=UPI0003208A75|nr:cupin domain-containing protein [Robiginitalea biformata]
MTRIRLFYLAIFLFVFLGCKSEKSPPESLAINLDDVEWGEAGDGSIAPAGTRTALQSTNPNTGGISYYAWFPAGGFFDEHWHTHDEYVVLISGEVTIKLGKEIYNLKPGAFIVIPGEMPHYWDIPETGDAIILVKRDGPPDFHFVDR